METDQIENLKMQLANIPPNERIEEQQKIRDKINQLKQGNNIIAEFKNDVFISCHGSVEKWVELYFIESLKHWLKDKLLEPKICLSKQPNLKKDELLYSKCFISLWTPDYFKDLSWEYEFQVMYYRKCQGFEVIIPVILQDGNKFIPKFIRNKNIIPAYYFSDYVVPEIYLLGFGKSDRGIDFHHKMKELSEQIYGIINRVTLSKIDDEWFNPPIKPIPEEEKIMGDLGFDNIFF